MKIAILSQLWPDAVKALQRNHVCLQAINPSASCKSRMLQTAEVVILRSPVKLDRRALEDAPHLRLIVRAGAGLEAIDIDCALRRGVIVASIPLSSDSVAEHIFGLLLSLYRNIPVLHRGLTQGHWGKHDKWGDELCEKTLGLVGFGRIGIRTAEIASAFRMRLLVYDRSPKKGHKLEAAERLAARRVSLRDLFARSDAISIQTPLNDSSRNLIGAEMLQLMQRHAVLINVGRGGIVDETALFESLSKKRIGGAAMDVFAREPPEHSPLLTLDNFVGTPHVAAQTRDAQRRVGSDVVRLVEAFAMGRDLAPFGCVVTTCTHQ